MRLSCLLFILLAALTMPGVAAELESNDFAVGFDLTLEDDATFYELELPLEAYGFFTKDDLADLRVFNSSGQIVPHQLRPQLPNQLTDAVRVRALPFFPLPGADILAEGALALRVVRNRDGTIIDVHTDGMNSRQQRSSGWLVDLGAKQQGKLELNLSWKEEAENRFGTVRIDSSNDLVHWAPLTTSAVASLTFQGQHLKRNGISLPPTHGRYLRLIWPDELDSLHLTAIELQVSTREHHRQPLQHLTQPATNNTGRHYDYLLPGPFPTEELQLLLPATNQLAECTITSSADGTKKWFTHWRGLVYRLGKNDQEIDSGPIRINRTRHRYWRVSCAASDANLAQPPALDVGWRPDRLLFLAQGEPPYQLAVGSQKALKARFAVDLLDKRMINPGRAAIGNRHPLGGGSRLEPPIIPWQGKQLVLWCLLAGGVLLIGFLAWTLYRQLRNGGDLPPNDSD